jgi:predicted alpha/beta hydrolase family esterase
MKPQLVILHGGMVYESHEKYLEALRMMPVDASYFVRHKKWKDWIDEQLREAYEIFRPEMPQPRNAQYEEWSIWFERMIPFLRDGVVLVGHSLGGIFLAKYLSQHDLPMNIKATVLVAAPFNDESIESLGSFCIQGSLERFAKQGGAIHLWFSTDDPVVSFEEYHRYKHALPSAQEKTFTDRGHFSLETFPELESFLRSLI